MDFTDDVQAEQRSADRVIRGFLVSHVVSQNITVEDCVLAVQSAALEALESANRTDVEWANFILDELGLPC